MNTQLKELPENMTTAQVLEVIEEVFGSGGMMQFIDYMMEGDSEE